jgi:hypothetical protein
MFLKAADYGFIGHRLKELISTPGQGWEKVVHGAKN